MPVCDRPTIKARRRCGPATPPTSRDKKKPQSERKHCTAVSSTTVQRTAAVTSRRSQSPSPTAFNKTTSAESRLQPARRRQPSLTSTSVPRLVADIVDISSASREANASTTVSEMDSCFSFASPAPPAPPAAAVINVSSSSEAEVTSPDCQIIKYCLRGNATVANSYCREAISISSCSSDDELSAPTVAPDSLAASRCEAVLSHFKVRHFCC